MEKERLFLLDFFRGSLIVLIIFYHYIFNLSYFLNYPIDLQALPLRLIPAISSSLFLLISGYSTSLSRNSLKRGLRILLWAGLISLVTMIVTPEGPIYFGILHSIGSMILIAYLLRNRPDWLILILAIFFYLAGFYVDRISPNHNYLLFLGIVGKGFSSLDYYPLFPSGAYFLLGNFFARKNWGKFLKYKIKNKIGEAIAFAGKNSLHFYLLHQPLFFLLYFLINLLLKML